MELSDTIHKFDLCPYGSPTSFEDRRVERNDVFSMGELLNTLPKKDKVYGIPEGSRVRHQTIVTKRRNVKIIVTWVGYIFQGVIHHSGHLYLKPCEFVKAQVRKLGGKSVSGYDMEVEIEGVWVPYSVVSR